ncbi:helix-turn-helix transcriptional regulator [Parapedobacter sp. GCM10030251]|uniref:helix-turn-helix transcriptional regulator n=1 Tax=Parapedobacter sp. GCM10030251 TaxID=3273419 RepID=UPI0036154EC2
MLKSKKDYADNESLDINEASDYLPDLGHLVELAKGGSPAFLTEFSKRYPEVLNKLLTKAPTLIGKELELCAYLHLQFATKEVAYCTNCTVRSIENRKYRVRKKLGLSGKVDLVAWIISL